MAASAAPLVVPHGEPDAGTRGSLAASACQSASVAAYPLRCLATAPASATPFKVQFSSYVVNIGTFFQNTQFPYTGAWGSAANPLYAPFKSSFNGVMFHESAVPIAGITDGTSNTIAMGARERTNEYAALSWLSREGLSDELPIGIARAAEVLLTGATFDGHRAVELGIASRALPADEVLPAALSMARDIATHTAPRAVAASARAPSGRREDPSPR